MFKSDLINMVEFFLIDFLIKSLHHTCLKKIDLILRKMVIPIICIGLNHYSP